MTYYIECSDKDIDSIHLGDEYKLDKMTINDFCFVESSNDKAQLILNCGNHLYEMLEIRKGNYVDNPLLGLLQILVDKRIVSAINLPNKYELPLDIFVKTLKTYLSVIELKNESKIDKIISFIECAFERHEFVEADSYNYRYECNDGIVTVFGSMIPMMMVKDYLFKFI